MFIYLHRNVVSLQTHNKLKRQLSQLMKKHAQFQTVLDASHVNQSSVQSEVNFNIFFKNKFSFFKLG